MRLCLLVGLVLAGAGCSNGGAPDASSSADGAEEKSEKRVGPPEVATVTIGEIEFAAIHWGMDRGLAQNGGYIAALDADSGEELWILKIYDVEYDPDKEQDVQDVFIETMVRSGTDLLVTDEEGRRYRVDPATRTVQDLGQ